jgi:uroporphyrin-III C-methyltransferase/precorrin-2 dehydrogenase/sirohydrochlorin ferrochelatase
MKTKTLPILIKNQKILLIGGGKVALQKAQVLYSNNIDFKIISKKLNKKILSTSNDIEKKLFKVEDIKDF